METFYQGGKTHLGHDEYRMRNTEALEKHWYLVFVAYALLHLDCLPLPPTKRVVLENSNVAKLASIQYLSVHSLPQEDCYDTNDASAREL